MVRMSHDHFDGMPHFGYCAPHCSKGYKRWSEEEEEGKWEIRASIERCRVREHWLGSDQLAAMGTGWRGKACGPSWSSWKRQSVWRCSKVNTSNILIFVPFIPLYISCITLWKGIFRRCRGVDWAQAVSPFHWVLCCQGFLFFIHLSNFHSKLNHTNVSKNIIIWSFLLRQVSHMQMQDLRILVMPKNLRDVKDQVHTPFTPNKFFLSGCGQSSRETDWKCSSTGSWRERQVARGLKNHSFITNTKYQTGAGWERKYFLKCRLLKFSNQISALLWYFQLPRGQWRASVEMGAGP